VECLIATLLLTTVLHLSNRPGLGAYTGLAAGGLVAVYITLTGQISGMSMNPARTLASAVFAGPAARRALWVYFTAPPAGMLVAAALFLATPGGEVYCAKVCPHGDGPCPFLCEYATLAAGSNGVEEQASNEQR
jgi:aquaporin Z